MDSERGDNEFTPFRNIINEWYAKDTSKKIRAVFRAKGLSGKPLSTHPPYGYCKGEDGTWLVDEDTAPVVKLIFQLCAEGNGPSKIARMLTERGIPTVRRETPAAWICSTVANILERREYLGHTVNFKTTRKSYKHKKQLRNPVEQHAVFENTHEAIIDLETWELVQKIRAQRRRPTKMGEMGMFSGLVYCSDCGNRLHHCRTKSWTPEQENYVCGTYKQKRGACSAHYIRAVVLERLVLENLREVISYVRSHRDDFIRRMTSNQLSMQAEGKAKAKRQLDGQTRRVAEIDAIIKQLYEDRVTGKLTDERFAKLSADYEHEQKEIARNAKELRDTIHACEQQDVHIRSFLNAVRKYTEPTELTPAMVHELIDKVIVHAPDKSSGKRTQRIDIHYNFIGEIDLTQESTAKETA